MSDQEKAIIEEWTDIEGIHFGLSELHGGGFPSKRGIVGYRITNLENWEELFYELAIQNAVEYLVLIGQIKENDFGTIRTRRIRL